MYKRNYRCNFVVLFVFCVVSTANAFGASPTAIRHDKVTPKTALDLSPKSVKNPLTKVHATLDMPSTGTYDQPSQLGAAGGFVKARLPGVALAAALAKMSIALSKIQRFSHVSPLLWATILGMGYGNFVHRGEAKRATATGIKFSKGRLLRLGIILYGFKITLQQIAGIGFAGLGTDIFMVSSTLALGITLGTKLFKLDEATSTLISSGAAICGCSAVLATQPVVGGESHQVSAAVGTVVLGGTASMFLYPILFKMVPFLKASPTLMGIYTGSTIHEIAGVVAAGNAMGAEVASIAVVTKLARVLLLAPALTSLSWLKNQRCLREATAAGTQYAKKNCKLVLPWFAFGFVGISALNSVVTFPTALVKMAGKTSAFSLLCAMAALGIESDFQEIRKLGPKPILLATMLWGWLAVGGLGVARLFLRV